MNKTLKDRCLKEVELLKNVDHANVIKFYESFIFENELYIATEFADKGDLRKYLKKRIIEKDSLDELQVFDLIRQICLGLNHLHEKRIIHRDLKPANILMFSEGKVKIGDLGLGRELSDSSFSAFSLVGTPLYMSPELINKSGYDFRTDIWSLGCITYELLTLKPPFFVEKNIEKLNFQICSADYQKLSSNNFSNEVRNLVDKMLQVNPNDRTTILQTISNMEMILDTIESKTRIDPFIVMEDILEKLKLLDYENTYCRKFKKETFTKYTFSCNVFGKPNTPGVLSFENKNSGMNNFPQFKAFYDLCKWLIYIIENKIKLNNLYLEEISPNIFDNKSKLSIEELLKNLLEILKQLGIKVLDNAKLTNGFGEGVCLIITQLIDKILINQNFGFKQPNFFNLEKSKKKQQQSKEKSQNLKSDNNKQYVQNQNNLQNSIPLVEAILSFDEEKFMKDRSKVNSQSSNLTKDTNYTDKNYRLDEEIDLLFPNDYYENIETNITSIKSKFKTLSINFSVKLKNEEITRNLHFNDESIKEMKKYENLFNSKSDYIYKDYGKDIESLNQTFEKIKSNKNVKNNIEDNINKLIEKKEILQNKIDKYKKNGLFTNMNNNISSEEIIKSIKHLQTMIVNKSISSSIKNSEIIRNFQNIEANKKYIKENTDEEGLFDEIT